MSVTVMRLSFQRLNPRVIVYRNYNSFFNENYRESLRIQERLVFTNLIRFSRLRFLIDYLPILNLRVLVQWLIILFIFSSIKKANRLISKGMSVLLFDVLMDFL